MTPIIEISEAHPDEQPPLATDTPLFSVPHRRLNILTGEWVLVSPQRADRPWQGQVELVGKLNDVEYDPQCYLCPGNEREGGQRNPDYTDTFVFTNDFPALIPSPDGTRIHCQNLLIGQTESGLCRVVCYSPRHDRNLARMDTTEIARVVDVWAAQFDSLAAISWVSYVQIFENRGALMGASNPHPHGQIWANEHIPDAPATELARLNDYQSSHGSCLLCDYLTLELAQADRVVCSNQGFVAVVPFWAVWPYETLVLTRRHVGAISDLLSTERDDLADILSQLTRRYDSLFRSLFPFSMGFHQRPTNAGAHDEAHLHAHFFPPLLRSASVRKHMVGYELLCEPQRDLSPEAAATALQRVPTS